MRLPCCTFIILCLSQTLIGQEQQQVADPVDVRLNVLLMPATKDPKVNYAVDVPGYYDNFSTSTDNLSMGLRAEVGLVGTVHRFSPSVSLLLGGMVFYGSQRASTFEDGEREISGQTGPLKMTVLGLNLLTALDLRINSVLNLEFGPYVGLGGSTISDTGVGVDGPDSRVTEKGHGDYEEAGISLALYARNKDRSMIFGLGVRYFAAYTEADLRFNLVDSDGTWYYGALHEKVEIRQHGFAPSLTFGLSF